MPLIGWKCPSHGEEPGRINEFSYCRTKCKKLCTAPNVLAAMEQIEEDNYHTGNRISVTMLTGGCRRRTVLERLIPYAVEPAKLLPTFRGTIIHAIVEQSLSKLGPDDFDVEKHLELPVTTRSGKWILNGTIDLKDKNRRTIFDIKTLKDYALQQMIKGRNKGTWSAHIPDYYVKQLNLYRYMDKLTTGFEAEKLRLQVIDFGQLVLTGTTPLLAVKEGFKFVNSEFDIPDVPILDDATVKSWIDTDGDDWFKVLFLGERAPIRDDGYEWLCKSCQFYKTDDCPDPDEESMAGWRKLLGE